MKKTNPIVRTLVPALFAALIAVGTLHAQDASVQTTTSLGLTAAPTSSTTNINTDTTTPGSTTTGKRGGLLQMRDHAQTQTQTQTQGQKNVDRMKARASSEIDRRIAALNKLGVRVDGEKNVSDTTKTSLQATAQNQISVLTSLKTKISADTDAATLKTDVGTIAKSYRIFMLVIPQGAITTTSDRITTTTDLMTTLGTKLQTRITGAQTAGKNVSVITPLYTDYTAKIADAKVQAQAAVSLTANLAPDNGDQTIMDANKTALQNARAKVKAGRDDLVAARKDAQDIVAALKAFHLTTDTSAATTTQTTTAAPTTTP